MVLKMKLLFLMVYGLFMVMNVDCVEQKCKNFQNYNYTAKTYEGDKKTYYECEIDGNLTDKSETVTTNTQLNRRSNDDVTCVYYSSRNIVKFIPNSLFTTFINLEYLYINEGNKFEIIKREYFKNANKLKNLKVSQNDIKTLGPNLFEKALNLEHINFERNKIESIHKLAFAGLPNLQGIYLRKNKISSLHPTTFSFITKLNILELTDNTCINQKFVEANQKASEVERTINGSCSYTMSPDELAAIEEAKNLVEQQKIEAELKIQQEKLEKQQAKQNITELEAKLKIVNELNEQKQQTLENLQEKVKTQKEEINQTISNFTSIIETLRDDKKLCSDVNADLTRKFEESVIKQKSDAKMIVELNEDLKKLKLQVSMDAIYQKLEVKLMKLVEDKITTQITPKKDVLDACKLEMKDELKAIELKCSNIHQSLVERIDDQNHSSEKSYNELSTTCQNNLQDLQRKVERTDNSHDERLKKLELKSSGTPINYRGSFP